MFMSAPSFPYLWGRFCLLSTFHSTSAFEFRLLLVAMISFYHFLLRTSPHLPEITLFELSRIL